MRYLPLVLVCGCVAAETTARDPNESKVESLSTIPACPSGQWCTETPDAMAAGGSLHAVWAVDDSDVFAVGDSGTIMRRHDGTDWTAMASGTTANLRSVWGSSGSDVWAGGASRTLLHFDGTSWTSIGAPMTTVDSIWGSSANDVWFVGSTVVLHWDGAAFSTTGFGGTLVSVSGSGPNDVWVTGELTNLHRYNGSSWSTITVSTLGSSMNCVFVRALNDVWVATFMVTKETARYNGSRWTTFKTGMALFQSIAGEAANDVWAVGNSKIGHWNGTSWTTEEPFGSNAGLWSVTTTADNLWIVGDGGLIAHRAL